MRYVVTTGRFEHLHTKGDGSIFEEYGGSLDAALQGVNYRDETKFVKQGWRAKGFTPCYLFKHPV